MTPDAYKDELTRGREAVRTHRAATIVLSLALLVALLTIYQQMGAARVIVTPPVIDRVFWVSGNKVSSDYLELMGPFIAQMVLDISPQSVPYKRDMLLKFVRPAAHGELRIRMDKEADRLVKSGATTAFRPARVTPSADTLSVRLDGVLTTYINSQAFNADASYLVQFEYDGGTLWVASFETVGKTQ